MELQTRPKPSSINRQGEVVHPVTCNTPRSTSSRENLSKMGVQSLHGNAFVRQNFMAVRVKEPGVCSFPCHVREAAFVYPLLAICASVELWLGMARWKKRRAEILATLFSRCRNDAKMTLDSCFAQLILRSNWIPAWSLLDPFWPPGWHRANDWLCSAFRPRHETQRPSAQHPLFEAPSRVAETQGSRIFRLLTPWVPYTRYNIIRQWHPISPHLSTKRGQKS